MNRALCSLLILCGAAIAARAESGIELGLPIACLPGVDCFIQQYVDLDPGPEAVDYRCGTATYETHKGTDFRVLSLAAAAKGVPVVASAAGRVKGVRDGMDDRLIVTPKDAAEIVDRECGNGVVIDHGGGWETQYCHLRRGSVTARQGEAVEAGAPLGLVGYSGNAQFAHVHLAVRRKGEVIDPFSGRAPDGACQATDAALTTSLWRPELRGKLGYSDGEIIEFGFAGAPVTPAEAERGAIAPPDAAAAALVFFVRVINLRQGDSLRLAADGPANFSAAQTVPPLEKAKAHYVAFAGKQRTTERWPTGRYNGKVEILREGKIIVRKEAAFDIP